MTGRFDLLAVDSDGPSRQRLMVAFAVAVVVSIGLGLVPYGRTIIYPFALLATWAHEMGHGLGALLTGNRFVDLELYSSLGGVARTAGADGLERVFVSALGLIGPAVAGAIVMISGARKRTAPWTLAVVAVAVLVSTVLWVRNLFGFVSMVAIGVGLAAVARYAPPMSRVVVAQFVAIQLGLSAWASRDYLFIRGFERDGYMASDTQQIAEELFLPYWFWGGLLGGLSIVIVGWAFWSAWIRPFTVDEPSPA